jgi:hypothetical protein
MVSRGSFGISLARGARAFGAKRGAENRVLAREVFEATTILRQTNHVESGPKHHIRTLGCELCAVRGAPRRCSAGVPRRSDGEARRPTRGRARVARVSEALRPVVHLQWRHAKPRDPFNESCVVAERELLGEGRAAQQRELLVQRHVGHDVASALRDA